ncbi:hypothetical protein FGO68_gene7460 [Halteria grandinella]|uniref:Peptidyl-prolyl cis-trans isomerase n=1 Tax=Halteria grandinella TaxID=5974 RepID=A0A8J8NHC4_HALGN|nr:hypothetical protein FGO68_gene7460 [Halteria grandinella]
MKGSSCKITRTSNTYAFVYLEISIGGVPAGRLEFELFNNCPKTSENFKMLCLGERISSLTHKPLTYKGAIFHRIVPGFMCQGGDITKQNGTGGESIYGQRFEDENFKNKHTGKGLLSMSNCGKNTNGSQFFVTFDAFPHLDGRHVVFGRVVKGHHLLDQIADQGTLNGAIKKPVVIIDCGEVKEYM